MLFLLSSCTSSRNQGFYEKHSFEECDLEEPTNMSNKYEGNSHLLIVDD